MSREASGSIPGQSTGDGIFASLGAPVAHEDHPQRALQAALRMQMELSRYSARVVADGGGLYSKPQTRAIVEPWKNLEGFVGWPAVG